MRLFSFIKKTVAVLPLLLWSAEAHELPDNRATLVLRDARHLAVTLYIAYADALHQALAPQRPLEAFMMVYSAMKPEQMQKELLRAQVRLQSETRLYLAGGKELALTNWIWPDAKQVQALLQQRIMRAMVDPGNHTHEEPLEIHAEANAPEDVRALRIQFPDEFGKVLVVSFRPSQLWVEPKSRSPVIKFP